MCASVCVLL
uniref:Uncharacterized protein n=1 Tax=Anguilla anguilla TaxID=7936 RepID=A0A0E9PNE2_ANGAN